MPWSESESPSFTARHEAADAGHAADLLDDLERFREELSDRFDELPQGVSVVIHPRSLELALAQPWLPLARLAAAPASRRYMAGWFSQSELHVLSPAALAKRASAVEGSREALLLSPLHEYAHRVIGANNVFLPPPFTPRTFRRYLRWAWLCEGGATHFAGQTSYLRAAIARRLREGPRPAFPPAPRDAPLLGCTIFLLLEQEAGEDACAGLVSRLPPAGAATALERAFGRPVGEIERDWRELLRDFGATTRRDNVYRLPERRAGEGGDGAA